MARPHDRPMSENETLIEMRRLRAELADVREGLRHSSSYRHDGPSPRQLRNRAGIALLSALAVAVGLVCWMIYQLLEHTLGGLFNGLLPHPVRTTVRVLIEVAALLV